METERAFIDRIKDARAKRLASVFTYNADVDRIIALAERAIDTTWKPLEEFVPAPGVFILVTKEGHTERGIWQANGGVLPGDFDGFVISQTQKVRPQAFTHFFPLRVLWKGPGVVPHQYHPSTIHQGDCSVCGHTREAHGDD